MRLKSVLGLGSTHQFSKVSVRRRVSKGPRAANLAPKALRVGSEVEACTRNPVAGGGGGPPRMQEPLRSAQSGLGPLRRGVKSLKVKSSKGSKFKRLQV